MEKAYARFLALRRKVMAGIKKALEIDCTRFSQWVEPQNRCPAYSDKFLRELALKDLWGQMGEQRK
mgnify:CR=1 FL=1|jgi:hypothetical protein